jgi:8-oxo-dGTP pyrophosphatase MutT (NUDIX family)
MKEKNPWQTIKTTVAYDNPWIAVHHSDVINPSGNPGIYGVVHFKNLAIGIVPLDEALNTWLVGQYRYTLDQYSWEIPEGGCPLGTDPLEAAKRELREETGIEAQNWQKILDIHVSNSVTDEAGMAFVARNLTFGEAEPEETEQLRIRKLPFAEALDMVMRGDITDSLSVAALMKVQLLLNANQL